MCKLRSFGKQRSREIKTAVGGNNEADAQREETRMQEKVLMVIWILGSRCSIGPSLIHKTSQYSHNKFPILFKHIRNFSNMQQRIWVISQVKESLVLPLSSIMKASTTKHLHKQETTQEAGRSKVSPQGVFFYSISHHALLSLCIRDCLGL